MLEIMKENAVFSVDYEGTKEYYKTNSVCDCPCCRNLYAQIKNAAPNLEPYLADFGVDIFRPDEIGSVEMDDYIDYLFVGYTVSGQMKVPELYETKIDRLSITISSGKNPFEWFPHEQKGSCFFISISGLSLPWILDEPFPKAETIKERIKKFFKKLRLHLLT